MQLDQHDQIRFHQDLSVNCDEEFITNASSGAHIENHEFSIKTTVKSSSGGHVDTKN